MLHKNIQLRNSNIHEKGLIALAFIPKETIVWQLDKNEQKLTLEKLKKLPPERARLAYQYKDSYIIVNDDSEYMNHSCDPNTWWKDDETLVASRDIQPGEEITYDYATAEIDENYRNTWKCSCGASACRKIITSKDCLRPEFQRRYSGHLPSWTREFIQKTQSL